jgi:hypothetical protein
VRRTRTTGAKPTVGLPRTTLDKLAELIREADRMAIATMGNGLEHARHCGKLLIHAKRLVKHGQWEIWLKANTKIAIRTAQSYMALARLSEPEWRKKKNMTLHAALWGAGDSVPPNDKPQPEHHEDADPTDGPQWTDPARSGAELHEMTGGIGEEADPSEREEWYTMREAKRLLEAMIRQAYKLVGRKMVERIVKELLDELDSGADSIH